MTMQNKNTKCNEAELAELLFDAESASAHVKSHVAECAPCQQQLDELQATMTLLDDWKAAEPNPYFMTRLNARLDEERAAVPAGWFERMKMRFTYGSRHTYRPIAAMAMTVVLLVGGGTYVGLVGGWEPAAPPEQAAVVHDLQTLDSNAKLLDQLEAMSDAPTLGD